MKIRSLLCNKKSGLLLLLLVLAVAGVIWFDRPKLELPQASATVDIPADQLSVRWLGVSTLLFDDGATQVLIDGFFSRPSVFDVIFDRPVQPAEKEIQRRLQQYQIDRLSAVIPVHSHYDHAMDVGVVARLTGAVVIGSESTANIARGTGLVEEQILVAAQRGRYRFGEFEIEMIPSKHAPIVDGGPPFPGNIAKPLVFPAAVSSMREGGSYSVVIRHPLGNSLVQGSAGMEEGGLAGVKVDNAFLGIGGLSTLGEDYIGRYLNEMVTAPQAKRVFLIHYDDFTRRFGDTTAFPRLLDDLELTVAAIRRSQPNVSVTKLPFGLAVRLP